MIHWKCNACHHEWDGNESRNLCDWCGASGSQLGPLYSWTISKLWPKSRKED